MSLSVTNIWNRALQLIGAQGVSTVTDDSRNARACAKAWDMIRQAEFRDHTWSCLVKRATLAAADPAPEWGRASAFPLPEKFLRLLPTYPELNALDIDYQIESGYILTNEDSPLYIRYIEDSEVVNQYDSLLVEALAAKLALSICEEITQSNSKLGNAQTLYENAIRKAKRTNAIENRPSEAPDASWITCRR
jgi:hypothetical protein